jgi:hypothetical protein
MPSHIVFQWLDGRGWLVLSGGADTGGELRATALARSSADGGVACVALSSDPGAGDRLLDDVEDLGAPSGYVVDVAAEDDQTVHAKLGEAGVIVILTDGTAESVRSALTGAAIEGIQIAYQNGAVVLAEGACAMAFGGYLVTPEGGVAPGLGWLTDALVLHGVESAAAQAKDLLAVQPNGIAVGIGVGSALALGPDGQVETWGKGQVTVSLGADLGGS